MVCLHFVVKVMNYLKNKYHIDIFWTLIHCQSLTSFVFVPRNNILGEAGSSRLTEQEDRLSSQPGTVRLDAFTHCLVAKCTPEVMWLAALAVNNLINWGWIVGINNPSVSSSNLLWIVHINIRVLNKSSLFLHSLHFKWCIEMMPWSVQNSSRHWAAGELFRYQILNILWRLFCDP